jgi:hypothetical protein
MIPPLRLHQQPSANRCAETWMLPDSANRSTAAVFVLVDFGNFSGTPGVS